MKVLIINSVCGVGSAGRICANLARDFELQGHEVKIAYGRSCAVPEEYQKYAIWIGNDVDVKMHVFRMRLLDKPELRKQYADNTQKYEKTVYTRTVNTSLYEKLCCEIGGKS